MLKKSENFQKTGDTQKLMENAEIVTSSNSYIASYLQTFYISCTVQYLSLISYTLLHSDVLMSCWIAAIL